MISPRALEYATKPQTAGMRSCLINCLLRESKMLPKVEPIAVAFFFVSKKLKENFFC